MREYVWDEVFKTGEFAVCLQPSFPTYVGYSIVSHHRTTLRKVHTSVHFLEDKHPGLFFKVKDLNVGEILDVDGFIISSESDGKTKIIRPDWCVRMESDPVN